MDVARVFRGFLARKKFKKLLLRLPRYAAPLLQRGIRVFLRRTFFRRLAKVTREAQKDWRHVKWITPSTHFKTASDYLYEVYRRHMARNYRNSLPRPRQIILQEKLQASELFKGKKDVYPASYVSPVSFRASLLYESSIVLLFLFCFVTGLGSPSKVTASTLVGPQGGRRSSAGRRSWLPRAF